MTWQQIQNQRGSQLASSSALSLLCNIASCLHDLFLLLQSHQSHFSERDVVAYLTAFFLHDRVNALQTMLQKPAWKEHHHLFKTEVMKLEEQIATFSCSILNRLVSGDGASWRTREENVLHDLFFMNS